MTIASEEAEQEYLKRVDREFRAAAVLQPFTLHHEAMFMYHPSLLEQVVESALSCRLGWREKNRVEWAARTLRAKMVIEGKVKEVPNDDDATDRRGRRGTTKPRLVARAAGRPRHRRAGG